MKFDIPIVKDQVRAGSTIRENIKKHIVWLALSTREGEERELLRCWQCHHKNNSNELMIIVPRHPERFEQVYKWARETMLKVEYRSYLFEKSSFLSKDSPSIIIGNTLGEVQMYLSLSDIVLIGGSVKNSGGQSPLDAARLGKAIFFGHYMNNFSEISEQLLLQRSAIQIGTYKEWFFRGQTLFNSEKDFRQLCTGASRFVNSNMGSTRKYAELIVKKT
jgi:3-deoxy-D-manno-octulosonic-acid transferase